MPAAYAHITLVNELFQVPRMNRITGFVDEAQDALLNESKYCEFGSVSPDYPYMHLEDSGSKAWADLMHKHKVGGLIKRGIEQTKGMSGKQRDRCFAWMLGFAAHVIADVSIHPVVEKRVGPYELFSKEHRICEMHQDVHVFERMNLGGVRLSEHLEQNIARCDMGQISGLWGSMLKGTYPAEFENYEPKFARWHDRFETMIEDIAAHGFVYFGRHILPDISGLTYPAKTALDQSYLNGLKTPEGTDNYDAIFDRAINNVSVFWGYIARAVFADGTGYKTRFGNWNIDRGVKEEDLESSGQGKYIFWSGTCEKYT